MLGSCVSGVPGKVVPVRPSAATERNDLGFGARDVRLGLYDLGPMELIPKVIVAGLFMNPPPGIIPGGPEVTVDRLNRAWSELAPKYMFRQFQIAPDGTSAQFTGTSNDDAVILNPPLLQVRDQIALNAAKSADKAEDIIKTMARHLGAQQFVNLGIRLVYHAPAPDRDARGFIMSRLLGKTSDDLGELSGGGTSWVGIKVVSVIENRQYTLVIEPLQRDESLLFIDLDVQCPGEVDLDAIHSRAKDSEGFLKNAVNAWLDKH